MRNDKTREYVLVYKGEQIARYYCKRYWEAEQYFAGIYMLHGLTGEQFQSDDCKIISFPG